MYMGAAAGTKKVERASFFAAEMVVKDSSRPKRVR
jgi:hypothetical protein